MQTIDKQTISLSPSLAAMVDECGSIDAEIKRLTLAKDKLAKAIKESGAGRYDGAVFSGLVYSTTGRVSIDYETIAHRFCELNGIAFAPSPQLLAAHTTKSADSLSLKFSKV